MIKLVKWFDIQEVLLLVFLLCSLGYSQAPEAGIIDQLGEQLVSDMPFLDAEGDTVFLKDLIDRPTVISFVLLPLPRHLYAIT